MNYKKKYLKYKIKYLLAKKLYGGMPDGSMSMDVINTPNPEKRVRQKERNRRRNSRTLQH